LAELVRQSVTDQAAALGRALPALLIDANRIADTVLQGTHGRRRVGLGESFWQFRQYAQGDSAHRIDWRQSAKTQKLYVRETEWEAAHSLWLWRDATPSMDYASAKGLPTKREMADLLLLSLATLALRGGERVGILQGEPAPPATTPAGLQRLTERLAGAADPADDLPPRQDLKRYSTVVLFGDFLGPVERIAAAVERLSGQDIRGMIVQVLDPAEIVLPFSGRVRFEGSEGEASELAPRAERLRADYRARLAAQQKALERIATRAGWGVMLARTDQPPLQPLIRLHATLSGEV
jgi:uncharacterized protein (DUF58 family)